MKSFRCQPSYATRLLSLVLWVGLVIVAHAGAGPGSPAIEAELAVLLGSAKTAQGVGAVASAPAEPARVTWSQSGHLTFLGAPAGGYFPAGLTNGVQPEFIARQFLRQHARLFAGASPAEDFQPVRAKAQRARHYVRLQQHYAGLPVFAAHVTVQVGLQGGVEAVFSDIERDLRLLDNGSVALVPTVTADAAVHAVRTILTLGAPVSAFSNTTPSLVLFSPAVVGQTGDLRLAWDFRLRADWNGRRAEQMLVDARDGQVVFRNTLIHSALNRYINDYFTYTATTNEDGSILKSYPWVRTEGSAYSTNLQANFAYDGIGDAYQFFLLEHNRSNWVAYESFQRAMVRYCPNDQNCPWANAEYDGFGPNMNFGNQWTADDIVAHEYTHGVTDGESGLLYRNASGAMNESFSDIWGEFVDLTNVRGNDIPSVRWDVAEELPTGRIRSMKDPTIFNHPDRLGSPHYIPPPAQPSQANDYGGVHSNSGVLNKLCYVLTDGDTFNGSTVTGIGIFAVAELLYEVNANLLQPAADWPDLDNALAQAAINIGWNSTQRNNLYRARRAVEIAPPESLYVDKTSICPTPGGISNCVFNVGPYLTVKQGATNALAGDTLYIRTGNYNETLTFSNRLTLRPYDGAAAIGKP